jgi:hypothetical protein
MNIVFALSTTMFVVDRNNVKYAIHTKHHTQSINYSMFCSGVLTIDACGQALRFRWLPLDGGTQQPTEIWPKQWNIVGGDGAQDNHDGGGRCHIVSAVKFGGKKINKAKFVVV